MPLLAAALGPCQANRRWRLVNLYPAAPHPRTRGWRACAHTTRFAGEPAYSPAVTACYRAAHLPPHTRARNTPRYALCPFLLKPPRATTFTTRAGAQPRAWRCPGPVWITTHPHFFTHTQHPTQRFPLLPRHALPCCLHLPLHVIYLTTFRILVLTFRSSLLGI